MTKNVAEYLRRVIEEAAQSLPDATALTAVELHPVWTGNIAYEAGYKVRYEGVLYRCIQAHSSLPGWEPEKAASLWVRIEETHSGGAEDPIPYGGSMSLKAGLYYIQQDVVYLCIRDTVNPVYQDLADLVGLYVETA